MRKFKSIVKTISFSMAILGTTIGAGFVSGKEIANFLNVYGNFSYVVAILIGVVYFFSLKLFYKSSSMGIFQNSKLLDYFIIFNQFISLSAMMAGLNSLLSDYFGASYIFYILLIVAFFIILCGLEGLTNTNLVLMPIVVVFILYVGWNALSQNTHLNVEVISATPLKIATFFFIYVGLDIFGCYPICNTLHDKQTKKQQTLSSFIVASSISLLIICYLFSVLNRGSDYAYFDLPILHYMITNSEQLFLFACIIVGIGILTTLLSNGFILRELSNKYSKKNGFILFLIFFCGAYVVSFFGFSNIVEFLYPLIGIVGLFLMITLFILTRKKR